MSPVDGILCLLDKILDFMDFEDLEKMACVWKFFCYTATMDKLYIKFDFEEISSDKESLTIKEKDSLSQDNQGVIKHGNKSAPSANSTLYRTDTARLTKE